MKKKITLLFVFVATLLNAQQKSTGPIANGANMTGELSLDNGTSLATITLSGPNDRWFAMQFGSFTTGMQNGADLVYWNGSILVDARHNGIGIPPTDDITNNWTLVSNTDNSPVAGQRTIVYTRPFSTGDGNDFIFNYASTNIDLAMAKHQIADFALDYHGSSNRQVYLDTSLTVLGLEDFSLKAATVYPNPSTGKFTITSKTNINSIDVYNINGAFVKTIKIDNTTENIEFNLSGLPVGVYLLELRNDTEKIWKKVIVE